MRVNLAPLLMVRLLTRTLSHPPRFPAHRRLGKGDLSAFILHPLAFSRGKRRRGIKACKMGAGIAGWRQSARQVAERERPNGKNGHFEKSYANSKPSLPTKLNFRNHWLARYAFALAAVVAAFLLREG